MDAGIAHGEKDTLDAGGNIEVQAGLSKHGNGGSLIFQSGYGERTSSGAVTISTANAGKMGLVVRYLLQQALHLQVTRENFLL